MNSINANLIYLRQGVIVHQVNCQQVAGAGLARQIRDHFTGWYKHFKNVTPKLGNIDVWYDPAQCLYVVSFYSQPSYGIGLRTDYEAFEQCLVKLREWVVRFSVTCPIYFPHKIGCGLAGGNWEIISSLIGKYFPESFVVKL